MDDTGQQRLFRGKIWIDPERQDMYLRVRVPYTPPNIATVIPMLFPSCRSLASSPSYDLATEERHELVRAITG
jgi:hypothetical protein